MALKLGNKTIDFPFVLAPMAGITNAPFRYLMREMGAGVVVSELISSTGIEYASRKTEELCAFFENESPTGLQIFGENADHLAFAAKKLEAAGAEFIDINLGCPVPKVVTKGGGSAMLKDPEKLYQTLKQVKDAIEIPLTIKIRTGWDSCSVNAHECVDAGAKAGVAWVAIHGRTRAQGYEGFADWDLIAQVKAKASVPIIGNGDIGSAEQAVKRFKESGCDGVMIGRGALRDPFIFLDTARLLGIELKTPQKPGEIKGISSVEVKAEMQKMLEKRNELLALDITKREYWPLVEKHAALTRMCFNPFFSGVQLRKFMTWYSAGIDGAAKFRKSLYEIPTNEDNFTKVLETGKEFFDRPNLQKSKSYLGESFLQGGHG